MSRSSKRQRVRLAITVHLAEDIGELHCHTHDISDTGLFLDVLLPDDATTIAMSLLDEEGQVIELWGEVARVVETPSGTHVGTGIRLLELPEAWQTLVDRVQARVSASTPPVRPRRLRVLVVADAPNRRGALALYVTSGWDVRFASDLTGVEEALAGFRIDAVVAEHELADRWTPALEAVRRYQPEARRIVRAAVRGGEARGVPEDLVHRVVDIRAGLDAVVEALSGEAW